MQIVPYQLASTNDKLTSRAGLVCLAQVMEKLDFGALVDKHFPAPGSNRGFEPSTFVNAFMLMLNEGGQCLDDLRHIREDTGLRTLLDGVQIPQADSAGDWLRRMGFRGVSAITQINKPILKAALHRCKRVTLDIDATALRSDQQTAQYTYLKHKWYMPMVGHIAQTGQVLSTDFRAGNVPPAKDNLAFVKQCVEALPAGVGVDLLRADAASYQVSIIEYCMTHEIGFAIRAKMSQALRDLIVSQTEDQWEPLSGRDNQAKREESVCRVVHTIGGLEKAFSVVIQRKPLRGQQPLELNGSEDDEQQMAHRGYLYRAIATNRESFSDSEVVHWYNQRAEDSENRIKELKADFGASRMPCNDFEANALYFALCSLAYNLFALMRALLPSPWESCRAKTLRWRLYALAGKVVRHGRQIKLKLQHQHTEFLREILASINRFALAP